MSRGSISRTSFPVDMWVSVYGGDRNKATMGFYISNSRVIE